MLSAEDAAQTWLDRANQIDEEVSAGQAAHGVADPTGSLVRAEATRAQFGISELIRVRGSELSESTITQLGQASDHLGQIVGNQIDGHLGDPVGAFFGSLGQSASETVQETEAFVQRGAAGVKKALDELPTITKYLAIAVIGLAVIYVVHEVR